MSRRKQLRPFKVQDDEDPNEAVPESKDPMVAKGGDDLNIDGAPTQLIGEPQFL